MKPMNVSEDLAVIVGEGPMPRSEVVKAFWVYIKGKNLQDPNNKRNINADEALKKVFGGKDCRQYVRDDETCFEAPFVIVFRGYF